MGRYRMGELRGDQTAKLPNLAHLTSCPRTPAPIVSRG
jgi:hypothetical protein